MGGETIGIRRTTKTKGITRGEYSMEILPLTYKEKGKSNP